TMKKPNKQFALRSYSPFPLQTILSYLGKDSVGQGIVQELSWEGCRILGNDPVVAGETLRVQFFFSTSEKPLRIEQATVKWVKGWEFGLAFNRLQHQEAHQLQRLLDELLGSGPPPAACLLGKMPCAHRKEQRPLSEQEKPNTAGWLSHTYESIGYKALFRPFTSSGPEDRAVPGPRNPAEYTLNEDSP